MICPACNKEFIGQQWHTNRTEWTNRNGTYRECPHCNHRFPEPPRKRKPDPRDEEVKRYKEALERIANREGATMRWPIIARAALKPRTEK